MTIGGKELIVCLYLNSVFKDNGDGTWCRRETDCGPLYSIILPVSVSSHNNKPFHTGNLVKPV